MTDAKRGPRPRIDWDRADWTRPNAEIARDLGTTKASVCRRRTALGLPTVWEREPAEKPAARIARLEAELAATRSALLALAEACEEAANAPPEVAAEAILAELDEIVGTPRVVGGATFADTARAIRRVCGVSDG